MYRKLAYFSIFPFVALSTASAQKSPGGSDHVLMEVVSDKYEDHEPGPVIQVPSSPSAPSAPSTDQVRLIQYIHGVGGNETAWGPVATRLRTDYKTTPQTPDYNVSQGLRMREVTDDMEEKLWDPERQLNESEIEDASLTIAVGHSMGGIVGRSIVRRLDQLGYDREDYDFQGLVTFGAPHDGAMVLNNLEDGITLMQRGCRDVLAGWLLDSTYTLLERQKPVVRWLAYTANVPTTLARVQRDICQSDFLADGFGFLAISTFAKTSSQDIAFGAPFMRELNEYTPPADFPMANVYGVEDAPVGLRVLSSLTSDVATEDPYDAAEDSDLIDNFEENLAQFDDRAEELDEIADDVNTNYRWWKALTGGFIAEFGKRKTREETAELLRNAANGYEAGSRWFQNLDRSWRAIIGADQYAVIDENIRCECFVTERPSNTIPDHPDANTPEECEALDDTDALTCESREIVLKAERLGLDSDGVVLAESAHSLTERFGARYFIARGSNHFQLRNDPNTQVAFEQWLFKEHDDADGEVDEGRPSRFFVTEPR